MWNDSFGGIGFVFKEGGGLTGIDLDKCIDPDTGAKPRRRLIRN
ncbi:hypothetical protein [Paenibacillus sp. 7541]|nr:hypothetical protein [Paenibacillus sp. 7541]